MVHHRLALHCRNMTRMGALYRRWAVCSTLPHAANKNVNSSRGAFCTRMSRVSMSCKSMSSNLHHSNLCNTCGCPLALPRTCLLQNLTRLEGSRVQRSWERARWELELGLRWQDLLPKSSSKHRGTYGGSLSRHQGCFLFCIDNRASRLTIERRGS